MNMSCLNSEVFAAVRVWKFFSQYLLVINHFAISSLWFIHLLKYHLTQSCFNKQNYISRIPEILLLVDGLRRRNWWTPNSPPVKLLNFWTNQQEILTINVENSDILCMVWTSFVWHHQNALLTLIVRVVHLIRTAQLGIVMARWPIHGHV